MKVPGIYLGLSLIQLMGEWSRGSKAAGFAFLGLETNDYDHPLFGAVVELDHFRTQSKPYRLRVTLAFVWCLEFSHSVSFELPKRPRWLGGDS